MTTSEGPFHEAMSSADGMLASAATLFEYLTTTLALARSPALVRALRAATSAREQLSLSYGERGPYVHLSGDAVVGCSVEAPRRRSGAPADVVDLRTILGNDHDAAVTLAETIERARVLPEVAAGSARSRVAATP